MSVRRVYRVVVTANGGDDPREHVHPLAPEIEPDTGAWVATPFYPPPVGWTRHYLTKGAAQNRRQWLQEEGVTATVGASEPVVWSA